MLLGGSMGMIEGHLESDRIMDPQPTTQEPDDDTPAPTDRFLVRAPSVNAVRRALGRAPGGVRVIGRYDRELIECRHTMNSHSYGRHWSIIVSRLHKAGLSVAENSSS
jgi:hypothetical protein